MSKYIKIIIKIGALMFYGGCIITVCGMMIWGIGWMIEETL